MIQQAHPVAPSGVVTLLFTDVEGSTRLWAADIKAMSASLQVHDEIIRQAVDAQGGYVFATAGDSFAVAFSKASEAFAAAVEMQRALAAATWPGPELRVRIGLHLGEAEERGGDYFGPVVNAAARVEAAGHGGQILLTDAVASVVDQAGLVDLGEHQLRDLPSPLRLWQAGAAVFPALRGVVRSLDTLPVRRTRLIGREREVSEVRARVGESRLVSLVGPGGIGKTSLAVEVAGRLGAEFDGGVHFADLASVNDPDGIVAALCRGVQLVVSSAPYEQLCQHLSAKRMLIVVDNCEHLIDDVAELVDRLLDDVPQLRLIVTSREHLDLDGETLVPVGPLESSVDSPAVRLFVERAIALSPAFTPNDRDLETISSICTRLDGLPLAIELAAGRVMTMGLADIERGLSDRFTLLAGSRRGKLRRQQSLRATIDWSIELLHDDERLLLARLAVIAGPFALDVAAAVGEMPASGAATLMSSLLAKSLVTRADDIAGEARFHPRDRAGVGSRRTEPSRRPPRRPRPPCQLVSAPGRVARHRPVDDRRLDHVSGEACSRRGGCRSTSSRNRYRRSGSDPRSELQQHRNGGSGPGREGDPIRRPRQWVDAMAMPAVPRGMGAPERCHGHDTVRAPVAAR